jgi:ADP-ribosylglycohydrolase
MNNVIGIFQLCPSALKGRILRESVAPAILCNPWKPPFGPLSWTSPRGCCLLAVNLGDDADTTGAVYASWPGIIMGKMEFRKRGG